MEQSIRTVIVLVVLVIIVVVSSIFIPPLFQPPRGIDGEYRDQPLYQQEESSQQNATITIQVYSDFQCPFCKEVMPTLHDLKRGYGDSVFIEFKHFPIVSIHQDAQLAAEAAECARSQGSFWQYHDLLFFNQNKMKREDLLEYATQLGLDDAKFANCIDGREKQQRVEQDLAEGISQGVRGTPTFFVNDIMLTGVQPVSAFEKIIQEKEEK